MSKIKLTKDTEDSTDNQFELLSKLPRIHGAELKNNISADYTLAKLEENERTFIQETYENAGFLKFLIDKYGNDSYTYKWNSNIKGWEKVDAGQYKKHPISKDEKELIKAYGDYLFKSLMISPDIMSILKRNDSNNFMLRLLGDVKIVDEKGMEQFDENNEGMIQRLKEKLNTQS